MHCSVSSSTTSPLPACGSHSQEDKIRFEKSDRMESLGERAHFDPALQKAPSAIAADPQSRTLCQPVSPTSSAPWLTPISQTGASGTTTRPPPKFKIAAKSTGPYTSRTAQFPTTCLAQPLLSLLAGAASTSPMPPASPTVSARAKGANNLATTSPGPMTRGRARGSPVKIASTIPPASDK